MNLRIVADDLTGALDSASQFTGGGPVPVFLSPLDAPVPRRAALDIGSRDADLDTSVEASRASAPFLAGGQPAFRKIDSLMRGHWPEELAALIRAGGFRRCIVAPAFPAQGRVTRGGRQVVLAPDGARPAGPDIAGQLGAVGLATGANGQVVVRDAETQEDLSRIVEQGRREGVDLWCGSAGLARALAGAPPAGADEGAGPVLAIVGSHHDVSRRQVAEAAAAHPSAVVRLGGHAGADADAVGERLASGRCLVGFDLEANLAAAEAARLIAARLGAVLPALPRPGRLIVAGGETLAAVARALGATSFLCRGEVAPGIPVSTLVGGVWDGLTVVSKSGAFGGPEFLRHSLVR